MADVAIATVVAVIGKAYARNADGELRELKPGDVLLEGETVVTPDGGSVELALADGSPFVVADVPEMLLTRDIVAERAAGAEESAIEDETITALLAALEGDGDILEGLEATAAGAGGAGGGEGEGSSFIRLARIVEETDEFTGLAAFDGGSGDLPEDDSAAPPPSPRTSELNSLTPRELMVAERVAHGASNREIADALEITERTVKAHLSAIFEKLEVRDRVQLALAMNNISTYATVN